MSYHVMIKANSPEELDEKILALKTRVASKGAVKIAPVVVEEEDEDEVEEVASPYKDTPSLTTVVDNETDSDGLPWDARIHTSKKTKCKDETWKLMKGVDKNLVAQVKNELRARVVNTFQKIAQNSAPVMTPPALTIAQPPVQQPVVHQAPPSLPPMQQFNGGHTFESFKSNFPLTISGLISEGKLSQEYVGSLIQHYGVKQIWELNETQQFEVFNLFVQHKVITKVG